jgi:DNA-binding CsgD family transcriptional regulator
VVRLTKDELNVLLEMADGHSYPIIAARLFMSQSKVTREAGNLFRKLNAVNSANAVHKAYQQGILERKTNNGN